MPELPEVETVRRTLLPVTKGKQIEEAKIYYPRVLPKNETEDFLADLERHTIIDIVRRGKYLIFNLDSPLKLIIHLRMTGQLIFQPDGEVPLVKHTSATFRFSDQSELRFVDQRKFGTIYLLPESEYFRITGLYTIGPEPLSSDFSQEYFAEKTKKQRLIKTILLDQKIIAGLGNIYVDEALFRAQVHPTRQGSSLTDQEIELLYNSIIAVLEEAIASHGTTIKDYRTGSGDTGQFQNKLRVYRKTGQACETCGSVIERIKVGGRSSHYCPSCQRMDHG